MDTRVSLSGCFLEGVEGFGRDEERKKVDEGSPGSFLNRDYSCHEVPTGA